MTAPRKAPGGLDNVLYVRVDEELKNKLIKMLAERNSTPRERVWSMSDMVRDLLWQHIDATRRDN